MKILNKKTTTTINTRSLWNTMVPMGSSGVTGSRSSSQDDECWWHLRCLAQGLCTNYTMWILYLVQITCFRDSKTDRRTYIQSHTDRPKTKSPVPWSLDSREWGLGNVSNYQWPTSVTCESRDYSPCPVLRYMYRCLRKTATMNLSFIQSVTSWLFNQHRKK